jgi:6-phosphogluconolactonase (cycloisomerase 2 family)
MTNDADANAVVHYGRTSTGRLVNVNTSPTGGRGSGPVSIPTLTPMDPPDQLLSQGALQLTPDHRFLLAVNTVDHTISVFRVKPDGDLERTAVDDSGGIWPNTVVAHGDLVYVANSGDQAHGVPATVAGFWLTRSGKLVPVPQPARTLGDPTISFPSQVLFSPDGRRLIVSDISTNQIDVFPVAVDGTLGTPTLNPSEGVNPFGMDITHDDILLVSEAAAATPNGSSISSYRLSGTHLTTISARVADGQSAGCWVKLTPDARFAYVSNTGSGTISEYTVSARGELTPVDPPTFRQGPSRGGVAAPLDLVISRDGKYLYQQYTALGVVGAYDIGRDGVLAPIAGGDGTGLPGLGSQGLDGF